MALEKSDQLHYPRCRITFCANAGVSVEIGGDRIFVDPFPGHRVPGFSGMNAGLWKNVQGNEAFSDPTLCICTHCHPDHFSKDHIREYLWRWPEMQLALPTEMFHGQILISGDEMSFRVGKTDVTCFRLQHTGEQYKDTDHYGLILQQGSFRILFTGDSEAPCDALLSYVQGVHLNVACLNFPWVTLQRSRAFLRDNLEIDHLLVFHLPFTQDDCYGYRKAAELAIGKLRDYADVRLLKEPLQQEDIL